MFFFVVGLISAVRDFRASGNEPEAYASCWIRRSTIQEALVQANAMLLENGWEVATVIEKRPISRDDYDDDSEGLPYYEQALIDDEVIVIIAAENLQ